MTTAAAIDTRICDRDGCVRTFVPTVRNKHQRYCSPSCRKAVTAEVARIRYESGEDGSGSQGPHGLRVVKGLPEGRLRPWPEDVRFADVPEGERRW